MARIFLSSTVLIILLTTLMINVAQVGSFGFGADWSWDWLWKNIGKLDRFNLGGPRLGHRSGYKGGGQRMSLGSDRWWEKFSETWEKNSKEDDSSEENIWESGNGNMYLTGKDKKPYNINNEVDSKLPGDVNSGAGNGGKNNNFNGEDGFGTNRVGDGSYNGNGNAETNMAGGSSTNYTSNGETKNGNMGTAAGSGSPYRFGSEEPENESGGQTPAVGDEQEMEGQQGTVGHAAAKPNHTEEPEVEENATQQNAANGKGGSVGTNSEREKMEAEDMRTSKSVSSTAVTTVTEEREFEAEDTTVKSTVSTTTPNGENEIEAEMEGNGQNPNNQESKSSSVKSASKGPQQGQRSNGQHQGQNSNGQQQGQISNGQHQGQNSNGQHQGQNSNGQHQGQNLNGQHQGQTLTGPQQRKISGGQHGRQYQKGENETEAEMEGNGQNPNNQESQFTSKAPQQGQSSTGWKQSQTSEMSTSGGIGEKESQPFAQKLHTSPAKLNPAVGNVPKIHIKPKVAAGDVTSSTANNAKESNDASVNNLSVNNWGNSASSKNNKFSGTKPVTHATQKSNDIHSQSSPNKAPVVSHIDKMKSLLAQQRPATIVKEFIDLTSGTAANQVSANGEESATEKQTSNSQQTQPTEDTMLKVSPKPVVSASKTSNNVIHKETAVLSLGNKDLLKLMTKMANKIKQSLMVPRTRDQNKIAGTPNKDVVTGMSSASILEGKGSNIDVVPTDGSISAGAKTDLLSRDQNMNNGINSEKASLSINNSKKDKVQGDLGQTTGSRNVLNVGQRLSSPMAESAGTMTQQKNITFFSVPQTKATDKNGDIGNKGVQGTQSINNILSQNNNLDIHSAIQAVSNNAKQPVQTGSVSKTINTKSVTPDTTPEQTTKWVSINKSGLGGGLGTGWRGSGGWRGGSGIQGRGDSKWLTGSANDAWISGARADARELATEMEGHWQSTVV